MPEPDKLKPFTFADGDTIKYDSTKSMDFILKYLPHELEKRGKGETYNPTRGSSLGVRALIGGDNPQAQVATLREKYGYVQPILYTKDNPKPGPEWLYNADMSDEEIRKQAHLGPGKETKVGFLVYDKAKKEYFRVNVPGLDWGDVAGMARGTAETLGDVIPSLLLSKGAGGAGAGVPNLESATMGTLGQMGASGVGGMLGKGIYNLAADNMGRVDPRPAKEQLNELAGTGMVHGMYGGGGEAAMRGLSAGGRALTGVTSPAKAAERKAAFSEMENLAPNEFFTPSSLLAGPLEKSATNWSGGFTRGLEGVLYKSAWANTKLGNKFRRITVAIDDYLKKNLDLATGEAPKKTTVLGRSMMERIGGKSAYEEGGRKSRYAKKGGFYGQQMDMAKILFGDIRGKFKNMNLNPQLVDKYLGQWARDLRTSPTGHADEILIGRRGFMTDIDKLLNRKKPLTYGEIDHLRERVGEFAAEAGFKKEASYKLYKNLYGNLKQLELDHLGPKLQRQLNKADTFYHDFMKDWENVLGKIAKAGSTNQPWKLVQTLIRTGDDEALQKIFKALDDTTVKKIRQRYIFEMGRKRDLSGFDVHRFTTNYHSQFTDSTKDVILSPGSALRESMDKLVAVIEHRLQKYPQKVNPLFTAGTLGAGAAVGGGLGYAQGGENRTAGDFFKGAILGAFVSIGGQIQMARLLTDPKFVKWMAGGLVDTPGSLLHNMDELAAIAASAEDPETKAAIGTYTTTLFTEVNRRYEMWKVRKESMKNMGMSLPPEGVDPAALKIHGE